MWWRLLPALLALTVVMSAPALAQSDATCIAYFEADTVYRNEIRVIQEKLAATLQGEPRRTSPDGRTIATKAEVMAFLAELGA